MANTAYESPPQAATALLRSKAQAGSKSVTPGWGCLVLADDAQRRKQFARAAEAANWLPHSCRSVGEAIQIGKRHRTQLAIVDLGFQSAVHKSALLHFAGQLASPQRLLLVCDEPEEGSFQNELLARQAGAWLYLPSPPVGDDLNDLFENARQVAAKITDLAGV